MSRLEIHIINGGIGESIVISLPNGDWGVVDCYTADVADSDSNPTLNFLRERHVETLEFLCLTHAHEDHYRGMIHLLENLEVKNFWRFGAFNPDELRDTFFAYLRDSAAEDGDPNEERKVRELTRLLGEVMRRWQLKEIEITKLCAHKTLYPQPYSSDSPLKIKAIAPSDRHIKEYEQALGKCFSDGKITDYFPPQRHNEVSAALVIEYGKTRLLLCGDVEQKGWKHVMHAYAPGEIAAHAVKVSHHGSDTGHIEGLWDAFAAAGQIYAVVTPYRRFSLPDLDTLLHIRKRTPHIYTTCRSATIGSDSAPKPYRFETQQPMKHFLKNWKKGKGDHVGMCSLSFDSEGVCQEPVCVGDARQVDWLPEAGL